MLASLAIAAALALPAPTGTVSGTVAYRERMALTADAEVVVRLDRFSDEGQVNLSEIRMKLNGNQVPVGFTIPYAFRDEPAGAAYGLRAEIWMGGKRRFESPSHSMVTLGNDLGVAMMLVGVEPNETGRFQGIEWRLRAIEGRDLDWAERRPTLTFGGDTGQITGFSGVNRFSGTFRFDAPHVQIDPGASTLMAGTPERMEVETSLFRLLPLANRLTVEEGQLLLWRGEKTLLTFDRADSTR